MQLSRRTVLVGAASSLACAFAGAQGEARFPPLIRLVVPFPPGGSNDVLARQLAPLLAKRLSTNVIVENRAGAAGVIGSDFVSKAARDGSVLLLTSSSLLTAIATQPALPFAGLAAFAPVALIAQGPMLVAVPAASGPRSLADLISAARAKPGAMNYGSSGVGSLGHMASELLTSQAHVQIAHVPYKGASEALLGLTTGQLQMMITNYSSVAAQVKAGRLAALAVTGPARSPAFPELPAVSETVSGYSVEIWSGVLAPAGLPPALVERLNREINDLADAPELREVLDLDGATPARISAAAFAQRLQGELAQWKRVATERGITTQ